MSVDMEALKMAGELMLFGMGGVFLVLFVLFLVSKGLLAAFPADKENK
ncbi:OadG-related small transporter subunit [Vagococcus carniphilus]|uniref:OadG-related small transporter subunit n=1 Tax=Vagococcus carniphilus TaxID=218144 RepID=A0A430B865_9ENTE|nr:OadG-related small transporter subunit [Vagococcus carniphilus]MDT2814211.1 OadG-related small transporter subunit [Vagococcus carniphilus]MDT2829329.1 OadG-related small transporter subunit [Vagococcus carniphilus]MDT2833464.1 OadG-related small transporter subunit [Vagococcus carniphilus]MDT2838788.1 OadG-related small transporter subunit [Vagococcus carniphilus]MDT2849082.1 OadG-related small transporter subunit [Vagococcus carniphilus]